MYNNNDGKGHQSAEKIIRTAARNTTVGGLYRYRFRSPFLMQNAPVFIL